MSFKNLDEHPTLRLPIKGKTYVVPSPDARTGLWVQAMVATTAAARAGVTPDQGDVDLVLDDDEELDLYKRVLGTAHQQLLDDGVPWHTLRKAGVTAFFWIAYGDDVAERYWNGGTPAPKAPAKAKKSAKSAPRA